MSRRGFREWRRLTLLIRVIGVIRGPSALVTHRVNHEIERYADGVAGIFLWIAVEVHELPGVAEVGVVCNNDHKAALVVVNTVNAGFLIVGLLPGWSTIATLALIRSLDDFIDVEESMKDLVLQ